MYYKMITTTAFALSMSACTPTTPTASSRIALSPEIERQGKALAGYTAIDPTSTLYRNLQAYQLGNGDVALCGEMNGKNRLGGYVGFQSLYLRFTPHSVSPTRQSMHLEFLADKACSILRSGRDIPLSGV